MSMLGVRGHTLLRVFLELTKSNNNRDLMVAAFGQSRR